jgi:hypothetical protein
MRRKLVGHDARPQPPRAPRARSRAPPPLLAKASGNLQCLSMPSCGPRQRARSPCYPYRRCFRHIWTSWLVAALSSAAGWRPPLALAVGRCVRTSETISGRSITPLEPRQLVCDRPRSGDVLAQLAQQRPRLRREPVGAASGRRSPSTGRPVPAADRPGARDAGGERLELPQETAPTWGRVWAWGEVPIQVGAGGGSNTAI